MDGMVMATRVGGGFGVGRVCPAAGWMLCRFVGGVPGNGCPACRRVPIM